MHAIKEILESRKAGHTICVVVEAPSTEDAIDAADQIVKAQGLQGIADGWIEISANDAHAIVATLLHRDLAYGAELMTFSRASDLSTALLDSVAEPHRYFTNGDWAVGDEGEATFNGWNPISDATFDSGIVCIGDGHAALFWVQDED
ncbi:MAG: hypothetical protein ACO1Q7_02980 [Gemmatimonas sp.]